MALQRTKMTLPLGVGLDTKTDAKLLPVGSNALVENSRFDKTGSLIKRFGKTELSSDVLNDAGTISDAVDVLESKRELCLATSDSFYSRHDALKPWVKKGDIRPSTLTTERVFQNSRSQAVPSSAYSDDYVCVAWYESDEEDTGNVVAGVLSRETMEPYVPATNLVAGVQVSKIECVRVGANFVVLYSTAAGNVFTSYISASDPESFSSPATLNACSDGQFSVSEYDSNVVVVAIHKATTTFTLGYVKSDGTFATAGDGYANSADVTVSYTGTLANLHVHARTAPASVIYLFLTEDGGFNNFLSAAIYNLSLSNTVAYFTVDSDTGVLAFPRAAAVNEGVSSVRVYYDADAAGNIIKRRTVSSGGVVGSAENYLYGLYLVGKPRANDTGVFVCARSQSAGQLGFYVFDSNRSTVARISLGNSSDSHVHRIDSNFVVIDGSSLSLTSLFARDVIGPATSVFDTITDTAGVQISIVDFSSGNSFSKAEFGDGLVISGSVPMYYDGASVTELGFNHFPIGLGVTPVAASGDIEAGTRLYTYIFEWVDNHGQIHRSAPAAPFSVTNNANDANELALYCISATSKQNVRFGIFRTLNGGTTFYRVDNPETDPVMVTSAQTVTFEDENSDDTINANEILYTNGGVLENIAPPACKSVVVYQNRVVLAGCEDRNEYWYSKQFIKGEGPGFNEAFTNRVDSGKGGINAVSVLDEKVVFLKSEEAFFDQGQGPTDTGTLNDFSIPQRIAGDAGTIYPKSVVQTPYGVMFKSSKGFVLLNRALQIEYLGNPVTFWDSLNITGAHLLSSKNQVVFTHSNGYALVYDHLEKKWNVWDNYESVGVTQWNGSLVTASSDGRVFYEDSTTYLDPGSEHVPLRLITPWVKLESLEGFQRMYEAILLAEIRGRCIVKFSVGYDYNPEWSETREFDTSTVWGDRSQTDGAYYTPSGTKFTGTSGEKSAVEIKFKPARQKCASVRLMIETDQKTSGDDYAELVITSLDLWLGFKGATNRTPSRKAAS